MDGSEEEAEEDEEDPVPPRSLRSSTNDSTTSTILFENLRRYKTLETYKETQKRRRDS